MFQSYQKFLKNLKFLSYRSDQFRLGYLLDLENR
jgi:hypothetical protein